MKEECKLVRLKDISILGPQSTNNLYLDDRVSFIPMECLRNGKIENRTILYSEAKGKYTYFEENDLLIAKVTPCFENGNIAIARNLTNKIGFGSSEIFVLRFKDTDQQYIFYYFQSNNFRELAISTMCGVGGLKRISPLFIRTFEFLLPNNHSQIKIRNYLDNRVTHITQKLSLLEKKKDSYLRLKKSLINQVVSKGFDPNIEMKDSGLDWLGRIPKHWEIKRLKELFIESKCTSVTGSEDLLSVSEYYGIARRIDKMQDDEEYETRANSLVGYKKCNIGDLVINIMLAWKKGLGISEYNGIVSPAYAVYTPIKLYPKYFHYLLRTDKYIAEFKRNSKGIIESRLRLYSDRFYNIKTARPPLCEQQAIADYLDEKCTKIDAVVENIEKQIEKLKDLKKSLINEVVTGQRKIEP